MEVTPPPANWAALTRSNLDVLVVVSEGLPEPRPGPLHQLLHCAEDVEDAVQPGTLQQSVLQCRLNPTQTRPGAVC